MSNFMDKKDQESSKILDRLITVFLGPFIVRQNNMYRIRWDIFIIIFVIYSIAIIPYDIAFIVSFKFILAKYNLLRVLLKPFFV